MRKADLDALTADDAPPDDGARAVQGVNKHQIEACPFCGAVVGAPVAVEITSGAKPDFAVRCENCDCTGPWAITAKLAIELWNFGFQASRPAEGRRTRRQPPPRNKPGTAAAPRN